MLRTIVIGLIIWLAAPAAAEPEIERVEIYKSARRLLLIADQNIVKAYSVSLGFQPSGHKQFEGDGRTPEGSYRIDFKNGNSAYHLSLRISYPNAADRAFAHRAGRSPGGDIFIHGQPNGWGFLAPFMQQFDWTAGCVAVSDDEIEEIWKLVEVGTEVVIRP